MSESLARVLRNPCDVQVWDQLARDFARTGTAPDSALVNGVMSHLRSIAHTKDSNANLKDLYLRLIGLTPIRGNTGLGLLEQMQLLNPTGWRENMAEDLDGLVDDESYFPLAARHAHLGVVRLVRGEGLCYMSEEVVPDMQDILRYVHGKQEVCEEGDVTPLYKVYRPDNVAQYILFEVDAVMHLCDFVGGRLPTVEELGSYRNLWLDERSYLTSLIQEEDGRILQATYQRRMPRPSRSDPSGQTRLVIPL